MYYLTISTNMIKKIETVHIIICDSNTELRIPTGTLLDKLSIDNWSDIHRYKYSTQFEFAIGKVSENYDGWIKMPCNNILVEKFMGQYITCPKIKLLCKFDNITNDTLYVSDSYIVCDTYPLSVKYCVDKLNVCLDITHIDLSKKKWSFCASILSKDRRIYCVYMSYEK